MWRRSKRPAIAAEIAALAETFTEDLDVAAQRSLEADEQQMIAQIRPLMKRWSEVRAKGDRTEQAKLDCQIDEKFDLLFEFNTGHSFIGRRQSVINIGNYKYAVIAMTALALLLVAGITLLLRARIVRPLQAAVSVADRIARGEL